MCVWKVTQSCAHDQCTASRLRVHLPLLEFDPVNTFSFSAQREVLSLDREGGGHGKAEGASLMLQCAWFFSFSLSGELPARLPLHDFP